MPLFLTAALYKFVDLPDCAALQAPLLAACESHDVKGTLLLAAEGINGTIAGPEAGVRAVLLHLRSDSRLTGLVHKESWASVPPFSRMKVRLKKEIVTLGVPDLNPAQMAGQYVRPQDWNALISDPEVVLIDTRNDYEVDLGTFRGAVDPRIKTFSHFPSWVAAQQSDGGVLFNAHGKKPKVAMFCTGGIRCEKSTAFMRLHGFDEVYHLEGGILKYLENVPQDQSLWRGECFVFDERVSVGHGLQQGPFELCRSCRHPLDEVQRASRHYIQGVSCAQCYDQTTPTRKLALAERQRQTELALQRNQAGAGPSPPTPEPSGKATAQVSDDGAGLA